MIVQHKSNRTLCPVRAWGKLITLILSYENTSKFTPINYFEDKKILHHISVDDMIIQIRGACDKLSFQLDRVGTLSIWTSFAMQLHLAGVKDHIITIQGRYESLSFLHYVRQI